jgi:hypothetical protein
VSSVAVGHKNWGWVWINIGTNFQAKLSAAASICLAMNMSLLSIESDQEMMCLKKLIPAGIELAYISIFEGIISFRHLYVKC